MPFSRTFRTSETQELLEGRLVGRMLLQRLAAGVKLQHAPCRSRAARLAYAHAPNNNECVCVVYRAPIGHCQVRRMYCVESECMSSQCAILL